MRGGKFELGDKVKHIKTGNIYTIIDVPSDCKLLEYNREPYYRYSDGKIVWVRCKSEMEDGRFI